MAKQFKRIIAQNGDGKTPPKKVESKKGELEDISTASFSSGKSAKISERSAMYKKKMKEAEALNKEGHKATGISGDIVYFNDPNGGEYSIREGVKTYVKKIPSYAMGNERIQKELITEEAKQDSVKKANFIRNQQKLQANRRSTR